jgi:hypothetical protein
MAHSSFMQGIWFLPSLIFGAVQGFTSGNWQMLIFAALSLGVWPLGAWLKHRRDFPLNQAVNFDGKDVWIGQHRLPRREIFWRREWHEALWAGLTSRSDLDALPSALEAARATGFRGSVPGSTWLGVDGSQRFEFSLADSGPHLLIVGATGTGKSELLRLLVTGWLNQTMETSLTLIDFKGGATMARFATHPRVVALATDLRLTDVVSIADTLERQLRERQMCLAKASASSIEDYWRRGSHLNRQIIVIDELGELLRQHPKLLSVLEQISSRGRSLGMHLVAANQSMAGISRNLLVNLRARVAIGDMDPIDLSQLGFKTRVQRTPSPENWRSARLKTGEGFEFDFWFPIGF